MIHFQTDQRCLKVERVIMDRWVNHLAKSSYDMIDLKFFRLWVNFSVFKHDLLIDQRSQWPERYRDEIISGLVVAAEDQFKAMFRLAFCVDHWCVYGAPRLEEIDACLFTCFEERDTFMLVTPKCNVYPAGNSFVLQTVAYRHTNLMAFISVLMQHKDVDVGCVNLTVVCQGSVKLNLIFYPRFV